MSAVFPPLNYVSLCLVLHDSCMPFLLSPFYHCSLLFNLCCFCCCCCFCWRTCAFLCTKKRVYASGESSSNVNRDESLTQAQARQQTGAASATHVSALQMASRAATFAAAQTEAISKQSVSIELPAIKEQAAAVAAAAAVMPEHKTAKKAHK